jgi:ectoine hydroxylase-related dioxygenase (phytanoyl-CoA dioxygenase family)
MKMLFKDNNDQSFFDEFGYIIYRNVLTEEIKSIDKLYSESLKNTPKEGLYESTGANDSDKNIYTSSVIKDTVQKFIENKFKDYSLYGGAFLVKSTLKSTELHLHQDWSFIDEQADSAGFIWMPLQEVDKNNGTIYLLEKSHAFFNRYRSGAYNSELISRYMIPEEFIKPVILNRGDILIYSPKLFHGSYKNKSKSDRVVATALVTTKSSPFQYIHKKDDFNAEVYDLTADIYLNEINYLSKGKVPPGSILKKTIPYEHVKITYKNINKALINKPISFMSILKTICRDFF